MRAGGRCLALWAALLILCLPARPTSQAVPDTFAYRVIDLAAGRVVAAAHEDVLRTPVLPGSIAKVATLVAALESGVIQPTTRIACPRRLTVEGHRLDCTHPDVGRPLGPAEALAHSCNGYFADVASRLPRAALDRGFARLGLPPSSASASVVASAVGIDGARIEPQRLLAAFVRLTTSDAAQLAPGVRAVLMEGLRGAADFGTASAFGARGLSALAKTGTASMPGGGFEGLVVAVTPADHPTRAVVGVAPGAAGLDAARLAAEVLVARGGLGQAASRSVRVGVARQSGYDVVSVPLETYVSRVVSAEGDPNAGTEAQKALAIVVRTFAVRNSGRHARDGFDLCDLTHCQVMGVASPASDAAARATEGQVLYFNGRVADVFYTASCGGHTERPSRVWAGSADPPYLPARAEPECEGQDRWRSDVNAPDVLKALLAWGRRGDQVRELQVMARAESGRAVALRVDGISPPEISGTDFRSAIGRALGWQLLKSTRFDVQRTATGYRFTGTGRGHGIGLCLLGASRLAAHGLRAPAILQQYFPGTVVKAEAAARPDARLRLVLPAGEERERARIDEVASRALREFSARLDLPMPASVSIVAHPTVEAYTRATGQASWTAGATRGAQVDLVPPSVLRERDILEATLRHEMAHVVTAESLKGKPIWYQEAVAMELAGGPVPAAPVPPAGGAGCPSDAEWRALRSRDDLQRAYGLAAACYAAERAKAQRRQ
jgi:stage II sporulation protein D